MAEYAEVLIICWQCRGTGKDPSDSEGDVTCVYCQGAGKLSYGHLEVTELNDKFGDLTDKVDAVMGKCNDIFEKLNE